MDGNATQDQLWIDGVQQVTRQTPGVPYSVVLLTERPVSVTVKALYVRPFMIPGKPVKLTRIVGVEAIRSLLGG